MHPQSPYQPPSSNLINPAKPQGQRRTIEEALNYRYDFSVGEVISEAWATVSGTKFSFFLGALLMLIVGMVVKLILSFLPTAIAYPISIVVNVIVGCFSAGYAVIALKYARGEQVEFSRDFFSITSVLAPLVLASVLTSLLAGLGTIFFMIPGIYLAVAYSLTQFIIIDHPNITFWQAMEASRKLITQKWFKVFGVFIVLVLLLILSIFSLGIGFLWTFPLLYLSLATIYRKMFDL